MLRSAWLGMLARLPAESMPNATPMLAGRLNTKTLPPTSHTCSHTCPQVFFHDPDGNMIELCNCQCLPVVPLSRSASAECSFSACANRQQQQQQEEACMPRLPSLGMAQRLRAVVEGDGGDGPDTPVCQGEGVPAGGTFSPMRLSG